jgi:hypothetical protein
MVTTLILVFPYWENTFNVHVYALTIKLEAILVEPGVGDLDYPIFFTSKKLSKS